MNVCISKYCSIKNNCFSVNGEVIFANSELSATEFLTALYRHEQLGYPKFFKMDYLAKTGFLAADLLLKDTAFYGDSLKKTMGIFLSNNSSSLDTDVAFQKTIGKEYFPSPSVFVYTLPNIVMGEIAIKHKIFGENTFFVSQEFNDRFVCDYVNQVFVEKDMESAIVGWVELFDQHCEAFLMLVEKKKGSINFTQEIIHKLYKS